MEVILEIVGSLCKGILDGQLLWIVLRELLVDSSEQLLGNSLHGLEERSVLSHGSNHHSDGFNCSSSKSHLVWGLRLNIIDDFLEQWHELVEVVSKLLLD